ncbi:MAG: EAL domain-containing protein [bacterium]
MPARNRKLRSISAGLIVLLGVVSIALAYYASSSYFNLSVEREQEFLQQLVSLRTEEKLDELQQNQADLGTRLQRENNFRTAFDQKDLVGLQNELNKAFHRFFVTSGLLDLKLLTVFDENFTVLAQSSGQETPLDNAHMLSCPDFLEASRQRTGADRLKVSSWRCLQNDQSIQSVLVPIGGLRPLGYLQICADPTHNLQQLPSSLAMPVKLESAAGKPLFTSPDWPAPDISSFLISRNQYLEDLGNPFITIDAAKEIGPFIRSLKSSRNRVLVGSTIVIAFTLLLILTLLGRAFRPLEDLKLAAQRVAKGEYTSIKNFSSYEEIATPIESFNKMSADLNRENHSRTLAQQALQQATEDAERMAQRAFEEKKFTQTTLNAISDGVITSSNDGRVQFMNPAAVQLTEVDPDLAIGRPLEEIFSINDQSHTLDSDSSGNWVNRELRLRKATGEEIDIESSSSVMYSPDGEVLGTVTVFSDVTQQRELTRRLSYAATHDALTGLVNRGEFERRLEETLRVAYMDQSTHTLCYLDLDQFKIVNDTCGHVAGDELLRQLTGLLKAKVSRRDTLGRLGGDEFGLLLENCPIDTAKNVAGKLLDAIRRFQFQWEDNAFTVGCSIGIVEFTGAGETIASIMSAADTACYLAKDRGRNRIEIMDAENPDIQQRQGEMRWVIDLNTALTQDKFELYRQRIVPAGIDNQSRQHFEILVRLRNDDGKLVNPDAFLPAAERFNLISKIDRWVVQNTLDWLKKSPVDDDALELSINLSGASITDRNFLDFVVQKIHEFDLNPEAICFEVTETAAISNLARAQRFINIVTGLGCKFALDDFGSGLSSFAYLKSLPVHYLKIDGLFIRDIHRDPVDLAMVRSINDVGHSMGLKTVAEFVENQKTIHILQELGVDYLQGYEIGRPEPLTAMLPPINQDS